MYINPSEYQRIFQDIKRTSLSHSTCKLIIFVSCLSIDSLCSAKILSIILRKELVQYQLIPVVGYSDLKRHYQKLDDDVSNVILVGCGAMLDLESFFEIDIEEYKIEASHNNSTTINYKRKIYVIDGHRPWNLDNLFGSSIVVCFDDGYVDTQLVDEKKAYETLIEQDDRSSELELELELEEENDEEEGRDSHDERLNSDEELNSDGEIIINSQDDQETVSRKRKRHEQRIKKLRKQFKKEISVLEDAIDVYYNQGTTITTSSTATIYALLTTIGETNIENLWLAIIGTSSLDSHYPEVYDKFQPLYKDEVLRLNPSTASNEKTADTTTLSIEKDYHLFLLRHWSLYDSFFYSSHVNSKLNLWTEDGKKKLHKLFAKMGISLATAQQKWLYMDISIKKQLPFIFNKYLPLYGLESIVREGFIRTFGFTGQLSAMECVEALTALLELDKRLLNPGIIDTIENNNDSLQAEEEGLIESRINSREKAWVNNFWSSWDALNMKSAALNGSGRSINSNFKKYKGFELLIQGLDHAKIIQQVIFKTGMSVLERKLIKNLRLYRLCVLHDGSIPDLHIFNNPLMLSKLGGWLSENITEIDFINNSQSLKPLVVASLDIMSDTYLVIGLAPKYPRGMLKSSNDKRDKNSNNEHDKSNITTRLNTFSVAFQQVASNSGAKVRIDSFDSSVIEIRKDDLSPFLERLTLSGLI